MVGQGEKDYFYQIAQRTGVDMEDVKISHPIFRLKMYIKLMDVMEHVFKVAGHHFLRDYSWSTDSVGFLLPQYWMYHGESLNVGHANEKFYLGFLKHYFGVDHGQ